MIVVDTGVLLAAFDSSDRDNRACVDLLTGLRLAGRPMLLPATVTAELGYLLEKYLGSAAEADFLLSVAEDDFTPVDLTAADYERMAALVERYDDLPLGTTDASVIAVAERLGLEEIATLDRRHFTVVRPTHVDSFALLPDLA